MTASISTGAFIGSAATPTAERACLPLSPSVATRKSEAPLATRCHEDSDLDDPDDPLEAAETSLGLGKDVQGALSGGERAGRDVHIAPKQPCGGQLAIGERQLAGGENECPGHDGREIVCNGFRRGRQLDSEFGETLFD
jgi:hypothetical protein